MSSTMPCPESETRPTMVDTPERIHMRILSDIQTLWEAKDFEGALELVEYVRSCLVNAMLDEYGPPDDYMGKVVQRLNIKGQVIEVLEDEDFRITYPKRPKLKYNGVKI